jgi:hypothetical protein
MRARSFMPLQKLRRINAMTSLTSTTTDPHQQIRLLLPWYLNQSLPFEEHRRVEIHVRDCPACRQELEGLENFAQALTEMPEPEGDAEASFAALRLKLSPRKADHAQAFDSANAAQYRKTPPPGGRQYFIRYAMAATLLLATVPLIRYTLQISSSEAYATLSDAKPVSPSRNELRIVFAKSLSNAEISAVLAEIHGQQVGEPNSIGAFTVRLEGGQDSPAQMQNAIALLRSRRDVLLAEPVVRP